VHVTTRDDGLTTISFVERMTAGEEICAHACIDYQFRDTAQETSKRPQRPKIIKAKRKQNDTDMIDVVMVEEGLLIPKSLLMKLGTENLEVLTRGREIVIRPKSKIEQYCGFISEKDYDEEFIKELERDFAEIGDI